MTKRDAEMLDLDKCGIHFSCPEGDYEGTVIVVCLVTQKLLVQKTVFLPKRLMMGTLGFKFREILKYKVVSRPDTSELKSGGPTRQYYAYAPTRGKDACILDDCSEAGDDQESDDDVCYDDLFKEESFELKIPPMLTSRIPMDNVVIDCIDDEFHQAVEHIFRQDCIGVTLEGPKIGRNGILSWLGMATSSCTFLFDVQSLGEDAFKRGLKKILENPNIEKVFHDCRQASDCLFHKYNTRLVNVFDTQVADLLVTMQRSKDSAYTKRVSPLDTCLRTYLEIPEEYIHKPKSLRSYEDEVVHSRFRPMRVDRRDVILKNVMYLRLLKRELNLAMLTPFHRAVEIYLNVLQTASDRELLLEPSVPGEPPKELMMEGVQIARFQEYVDVPSVVASGPPYRKLKNPIKSYAEYCDKLEKSKGHSRSRNDNEYLSSTDEVDDKSAVMCRMAMSLQIDSLFHKKSKVVENGVGFHSNQVHRNIPSSNKTTNEKVNSVNPFNSGEKKMSSHAQSFNSAASRRTNQSIDDVLSSSSNAETCSSTNSQVSSDSETENRPPRKSYQNILVEIRGSQKPKPTKQSNDSESSSDCIDSCDDDPWAALRAQFASTDCSAANVKSNFRFVPA